MLGHDISSIFPKKEILPVRRKDLLYLSAVGRSGSGMGIGFARFLRYPPAASVAVSVSFHKRDEHPDPSGFGDLDAFPPQNCKNLMFQFIHDRTPRIRDPARLLMFRRSFRVIIDIVFDPPELVARGCKCLCQTGFAAVLRIPLDGRPPASVPDLVQIP